MCSMTCAPPPTGQQCQLVVLLQHLPRCKHTRYKLSAPNWVKKHRVQAALMPWSYGYVPLPSLF